MFDPSVGFAPLMEAAKSALASGSYSEAEVLYARALGTGEQQHGDDDLSLVSALTGLGTTRVLAGRAEAGEPVLSRALAISETRLGSNHPNVALLLNELSRLYLKQSAYGFAEPLLMRLLALKRAKGDGHPEVATVLASLGVVHHALGRYETAEQVWRTVVDIRERTLAPNHFSIATALEHLAETCSARGEPSEALQAYARALTIRQANLGPEHPSVNALRERIADIQLQQTESGIETIAAPESVDVDWSPSASRAVSRLSAPAVPSFAEPPLRKTIQRSIPEANRVAVPTATTPSETYQNAILDIQRELEDEPQPQASTGVLAKFGAMTVFRQRAIVSSIVLGVVTMMAIVWATAASRRGSASEWVTQPRLVQSGTADSQRTAGATEALARPLGGDLGAIANAESLSTVEHHTTPSRTVVERDPDPGPGVPVLVLPSISQQAQIRIDSAIHSGDASRQTAADALREQLSVGDEALRTSLQTAAPTRARLIGDPPVPQYPSSMMGRSVSGRVVVRFDVDSLGRPVMRTFKVVQSPHDAFTESVRRVIPQMRFEPARQGGLDSHPTSDEVQIGFSFVRPTND